MSRAHAAPTTSANLNQHPEAMSRITISDVRQALAVLNRCHGFEPVEGYDPTPGRYTLDRSIGGVKLSRYTAGGGEQYVQQQRGTARECYQFIQGMIQGLEAARTYPTNGWGDLA